MGSGFEMEGIKEDDRIFEGDGRNFAVTWPALASTVRASTSIVRSITIKFVHRNTAVISFV